MKMKRQLWRIGIGGVLFTGILIGRSRIGNPWIELGVSLAVYILLGGDVLYKALRSILRGRAFDENFLMGLATVGAFAIGEYPEGVAVMLFYQIGELFQDYAVAKSRHSIASLMDIRPDYANLKVNGEWVRTEPEGVRTGDVIMVKPGERIPLDGRVVAGSSMIDTSAMTGESVPREAGIGSDILSGCINLNGAITVKVTREYAESTVSRVLDLVENAAVKKSRPERFITRFARYYTPFVVIVAVFLAFVPPLILGGQLADWVSRALVFLVVSCPCALVISIPLGFFGGIGGASRNGILIKGGNYMEALARARTVVFDKTGTLTRGVFDIQKVHPQGLTRDELLEATAYAESFSNHPIALSIRRAYGGEIDHERIGDVAELPGHGVRAKVDGRQVIAGNGRLMDRMGISHGRDTGAGTVVHVAVEGRYAGYILIGDALKADAARSIRELKEAGIQRTVMLTGDARDAGESAAKALGFDQVYTELLPTGKMEKLEELIAYKSAKDKIVYVGDGINDAPVLARADVGIAMGGLGSDAAIEAADVVIMDDRPSKIATAIRLSRKTMEIAYQNIVFALGVKGAVLIAGALGFASMWAAVFADVGVCVIAVLNAFRTLNTGQYGADQETIGEDVYPDTDA